MSVTNRSESQGLVAWLVLSALGGWEANCTQGVCDITERSGVVVTARHALGLEGGGDDCIPLLRVWDLSFAILAPSTILVRCALEVRLLCV